MRRIPIGRLLWLCLLLAPAAATAQSPAALVLDLQGEVAPPLSAFDEVDAGTELTLRPGARLMLEHYASCEAVIVTGGSVSVGAQALGLEAAEVTERRPVECAKVLALAGDSVTAGVVLRSAKPPAAVALAPTIVIAGESAGIDRLRVERDGREVATLPVRSGRVDWPEGGLFLSDGVRYRLVLGGTLERRVDVVADRDGPERLVLRQRPK